MPPPGSGKVREYSPKEAAKLPPPPAGSKYLTLNDGSVLWSAYMNHGDGGPMLMPEGVSLAENARLAEAIRQAPLGEGSSRAQDGAMLAWFRRGGPMDYQLVYGKGGKYEENYVDLTSYNYGAVAAAAGYSKEEMLLHAGNVNQLTSLYDQFFNGDKPKDTSSPHGNKVRNAEMMMKGYDDYVAGRITASKN
jgi:hypothetical protein